MCHDTVEEHRLQVAQMARQSSSSLMLLYSSQMASKCTGADPLRRGTLSSVYPPRKLATAKTHFGSLRPRTRHIHSSRRTYRPRGFFAWLNSRCGQQLLDGLLKILQLSKHNSIERLLMDINTQTFNLNHSIGCPFPMLPLARWAQQGRALIVSNQRCPLWASLASR